MLRGSLIQMHVPHSAFISLVFELLVCSLHYSLTLGILRDPSNMLIFPLETKLFKGREGST